LNEESAKKGFVIKDLEGEIMKLKEIIKLNQIEKPAPKNTFSDREVESLKQELHSI
jgi:hypothetical protein